MLRINLSPLTQKIIGCGVGENVTTEYPWILIRKQIIEDNLYLHPDSSDFLPIKNEINNYIGHDILIGYAPTSFSEEFFNICLTETSRNRVTKEIEKLRTEQENRVKNSVFKSCGIWREFGSTLDIDKLTIKNNRPLLETQASL